MSYGPVLLDVHMPFSYWRDTDLDQCDKSSDHRDPAFRPQADIVSEYCQALKKEIASLAADLSDNRLAGIHFSGGYLGIITADDLRDLLRTIRKGFHADKTVPLSGTMFPGSVDMLLASTYKDEHVTTLMFEVPSLSAREAERLGFPNALLALDKSLYVLASYGLGDFGLRIPVGIPGRTADTWHYLLGQINHYHPVHVEFVSVDPTVEEDSGFDVTVARLIEEGYCEVAEARLPGYRFLTLAKNIPAFATLRKMESTSAAEYLGVGLGATCHAGGFWTKNTTDMQRYLQKSSDYRELIVKVEER